jgi:Na+/melibiose symporter-like transporter
MATAPEHRVGLGTRLVYGVGAMAFGIKDHGFSYFLLIFYNQVMGLPAAKVGVAIMIALVVDAVMDPAIGQMSDNLRSRWGRRHPFMYAAALPAAVSYLLLWNPPAGWGENALFAYLVTVAILIRGCINCFEVPSAAMAAELTSDYDERTRLFSYRYLFGWIGGLIMYFSSLWFFLRPDEAHPVGQLNPAGYARYGWAAAALMITAILISAIGTHRHIPRFRQAPERKPRLRTLWREASAVFADRSFLMLLAGSLFNSIGFSVWLSSNLYFQTFFWGFASQEAAIFAGRK